MFAKVIAFSFFFVACTSFALSEEKDSDYDSSDESIYQNLGSRQEPFRLIENMIDEARAIVMGILRGELSDEIKEEIEKKDIDLTGSYDGVSKLVKKCLRKAKNKEEGKEIVKKCFEQAVKERQNEEEAGQSQGEEQSTVQSCIQDAMFEASQAASPLMMEAQEYGAMFREMVQKTASGLATCRGEQRPFQCMMGVWAEAQQNMTFMRDQVIDMMLIARDIYIQYMDDVRKCITPVEGVDEGEGEDEVLEEGEEEEEGEEDGTKKDPTPQPVKTETSTKSTPAYYDPVEESRRKVLARLP